MKDFVINWGKTFLFWSSVFDFIVMVVLIILTCAGAFTFMPEVNPLLTGILIILLYLNLFVSPKFAFYLFVDISDQLRRIAQNTAPQTPQNEQTKQTEPEQKDETFLTKGIYSK